MRQIQIHKDTIIYMAMYLKRQVYTDGVVNLRQSELDDYIKFVSDSLDRAKRYAGYDYQIVPGEPQYNFKYMNAEDRKRFEATRYTYDRQTGTYSTTSSGDDLVLKSLNMLPMAVRQHFYARGYEKVLNIYPKKGYYRKASKSLRALRRFEPKEALPKSEELKSEEPKPASPKAEEPKHDSPEPEEKNEEPGEE